VREKYGINAAFGTASARDAESGAMRRPNGFFLEGVGNVLPETTAFLRYDNLQNRAGSAPRTQSYALGVTQRIPNRGRIVLEYSHDFAGARRYHSLSLDTLLMY
jgi:hypothetical protein